MGARHLFKKPVKLELPNVFDVFAGVRTSFFVTESGVKACGFNKDRALGCGKSESSISTPVSILLPTGCAIATIRSGSKHTVI